MSKNTSTISEFINKANLKHNFKYNYSLVKYINNHTKIIIICPEHNEFIQEPRHHLSGHGCKHCHFDSMKLDTKSFISKSILIHGDRYSYNKDSFINTRTKFIITCRKHGDFSQTPHSHLNGQGCPDCGNKGYSRSNWIDYCLNKKSSDPKVYIIKVFNNDESFIKIGITADEISKRFKPGVRMPYSYEVLKEIKGSADFVFDKEKEFHILCKDYKYNPKISFNGETECFTLNAANLLC